MAIVLSFLSQFIQTVVRGPRDAGLYYQRHISLII